MSSQIAKINLAVAHLNLGLVLGRIGRVAEAKTVLRGCAGLDGAGLRDPRTHHAARVACLFHLGRLAMEEGRLQEAVNIFLEAVHNRPHYYAPQVTLCDTGMQQVLD
jgi:tetratricopeptide (TPR) repeat protein